MMVIDKRDFLEMFLKDKFVYTQYITNDGKYYKKTFRAILKKIFLMDNLCGWDIAFCDWEYDPPLKDLEWNTIYVHKTGENVWVRLYATEEQLISDYNFRSLQLYRP